MAENNFKEVNKAIDARDFVQHILGEPVEIRGEEYYWYSLNKPDEKTPSLCANKEFISDFSMNEEMGKGLIGVGGDLPQDVTGSPVTEESRRNSKDFFKEMFNKDGVSDDEEYYKKYGKYDNVSRDSDGGTE